MPRLNAILALALALPASLAADTPDFQRDVRPILSNHCYHCHGPDEQSRKGKLRLDIREDALKAGRSGEVAIIPGQADTSEIIRRILSPDQDEIMPPPEAKKPITDAQKDILKRWVAAGAEYAPHWAFAKPAAAPVPSGSHPVDHFIQEKLQAAGLTLAPPASPEALIRRVSLDLTGLPPTPEEVQTFVQEQSEHSSPEIRTSSYLSLVDRLLASPAYGERWARRWLDLARYADTNGYEKDRERSIWPYRDWVIKALNNDMPFDQFSIEQLAGDMHPGPAHRHRISSQYHAQ